VEHSAAAMHRLRCLRPCVADDSLSEKTALRVMVILAVFVSLLPTCLLQSAAAAPDAPSGATGSALLDTVQSRTAGKVPIAASASSPATTADHSRRRPVFFDHDGGVDDYISLLLLLSMPHIDLVNEAAHVVFAVS